MINVLCIVCSYCRTDIVAEDEDERWIPVEPV